MNWYDAFPQSMAPDMSDIAAFIGGEAEILWRELTEYMDSAYKAKPKLSYSGCSMKPGWNVKYSKSGQALGTLYPGEDEFSVLIVISYRLTEAMDRVLPELSNDMRARWAKAEDYMKIGRWMMFTIKTHETLEDYKKLMAVKIAPKA